MRVVHRADQHALIDTETGYRYGCRNRQDDLAPRSACRNDVQACAEKEPFDPALDAQLERRGVPIGPVPGEYGQRRIRSSEIDAPEMQAPNPVSARSETDLLHDRLHRAARSDDGREMLAVGRDSRRPPTGKARGHRKS